MKRRRARPDAISFNAAISASKKGGQCAKAQELLVEMKQHRARPLAISHGAAISAGAASGQCARAPGLLGASWSTRPKERM